MKKQQFILILLLIFIINTSRAQFPYFDPVGLVARTIEKNRVTDFQKQNLKTTAGYLGISGLAAVEKQTRTNFRFNSATSAFINYLDYSTMCNSYLNPFKKTKCSNKYNYLKSAHQMVLRLVNIQTENKINNGVKEQIMAKYSAITNTILKELELLKVKAEKDNFYTRLILR